MMSLKEKNHKKIYRPWGNYISIAEDNKWKIKLILVNPGQSLSLQKHLHRSEHWVLLMVEQKWKLIKIYFFLAKMKAHIFLLVRFIELSNPGEIPLRLVEVQSGGYLGEDDIIRLKDDYGRI